MAVVDIRTPRSGPDGILELDDEHFLAAWSGLTGEQRTAVGRRGYEREHRLIAFPLESQAPEIAESSTKSDFLNGIDKLQRIGELDLIVSNKGAIQPCEHNAKQLIGSDPRYDELHFDEFLCCMRIGERDWTDHDDRAALCWLQATHRVPGFTLAQVRSAVMVVAYARKLDSLRNYVASLPVWDGTQRIEMAFIDAWGAPDTCLTRAAANNFFIALLARAVRPGAQVDTLWVFEGAQGKFKSKSLRMLGGHFHAEISAAIGTTDYQRELRSIWIAEISEIDLRGREAATSKRILSSTSDRFVEKYEKHAVAYPRRAVAVATTNEAAYWQDATGARRLVPITVGDINIAMISDCREQWFAEARHLFESGATWWEFPVTITAAQEERQQVDPWEDLLCGFIANGRSVAHGYDMITKQPLIESVLWPEGWIASADIMQNWLKLAPHQQGQGSGVRLGRVMRRLGFRPQRHGKSRERGWQADTSEASNG